MFEVECPRDRVGIESVIRADASKLRSKIVSLEVPRISIATRVSLFLSFGELTSQLGTLGDVDKPYSPGAVGDEYIADLDVGAFREGDDHRVVRPSLRVVMQWLSWKPDRLEPKPPRKIAIQH